VFGACNRNHLLVASIDGAEGSGRCLLCRRGQNWRLNLLSFLVFLSAADLEPVAIHTGPWKFYPM
jgi:hypothetical protein